MEVFFEESVFSIEIPEVEYGWPRLLFLMSSLDSWLIECLRRVDIRIEVRDYYEKGFLHELVTRWVALDYIFPASSVEQQVGLPTVDTFTGT